MPESLEPCPFCGGSDVRVHNEADAVAVCFDCGAQGPAGDDAEWAMRLWNERCASGDDQEGGYERSCDPR